jgi:uncharacterized protein YdbL (DUF1318 family)
MTRTAKDNGDAQSTAVLAAPARASESAYIDVIRAAVDKDLPVEKLERLLDIQERWEAGQARKAFYAALAAFQDECPDILKTAKAHTAKYAKLAHIVKAITPVMRKHGLTYRFELNDATGANLTVTCIVTHIDGHSERMSMTAGPDSSGAKNAIQARASTVAYLERYTLCGALGIVTADEDDNGGKPQAAVAYINAAQRAALAQLAKDSKTDIEPMLAWAGCESLEEFPAALYAEAERTMLKKIKASKVGKDELPL